MPSDNATEHTQIEALEPVSGLNFTEQLSALLHNFDISLFHFLRPEWLWALLPSVILTVLLWRQKHRRSSWHRHIDPRLLKHLLDGQITRAQKHLYVALIFAWTLTCAALAGPSWHKLPQPVHKNTSARIILFDLSPSMQAKDLKPSRLVRARLKIIDLLQGRDEGLSALIVYAGEAHVVTPLTDDTDTIISQLPALSPGIMPMMGSNTEMAIDKALVLFSEAGINRGDILLVTDGVEDNARSTIRQQLKNSPFRLSILAVGTKEGAPIATGRGGFARDGMGAIVIARLNVAELRQLARDLGGRFSLIYSDSRDIQNLNNLAPQIDRQMRKITREFDVWQDAGPWLALLLLPMAWFSFRRGLILPVICLISLPLTPQNAEALEWQDLWKTADQQGQALLEQGEAKAAAKVFKDNNWRASAQYRAGNYKTAAQEFSLQDSAQADYNRANALAKSGKLEQAIDAYQQALEKQPDMEDAQFNLALIEQLKQQQEQKPEEQQGDKSNSDGESEDGSEQASSGDSPNDSQDQDQDKSKNDSPGDQPSDQSSNQPGDQAEDQQPDLGNSEADESDPEEPEKQPDYSDDTSEPQSDKSDQDSKPESKPKQQPKPKQQSDSESEDKPKNNSDQDIPAEPAQPSAEEQAKQAQLNQWLRGIPDDPGGLLKNKFQYQHQQQMRRRMRGEEDAPENGAADRW